jgi:hydrophobe/amphiphile efflux-1 (HAE1) family protein
MLQSRFLARRPIGASLLAIGIVLLGGVAYRQMPVALLPAVDLPTLSVSVSVPGAGPQTIATTVAAPLERQLGLIAGVTDLTSFSAFGFTSIVVQFELGRDIDAAAHDVQAAINAAANELPEDLPNPPTIQKSNPAMAPLLNLALTSDTLPPEKVYDYAQTVVAQKLSQIEGVSGVAIDGGDRSAMRVRVNPTALASLGLGLDDVRVAIADATVNMPKGSFDGPAHAAVIATNNLRFDEGAFRSLVIAHSADAAVRLRDVATVTTSTADTRAGGWFNDRRAIFVVVMRQPGANLVDAVERVRAALPLLGRWMPPEIEIKVFSDRSDTVRAAVADVQLTLVLAVALVMMVIFLFLRRVWATVIPSATIPVSLGGTVAILWLLGYSLDVLSLMALTISVGFVVDDAIVLIENIVRHRDAGHPPLQATRLALRQIGFTIISITAALLAAFIPLLFMRGVIGSFMQEFAITLATAIVISAVVSLTLAPPLCASFISTSRAPGRLPSRAAGGRWFAATLDFYARSLRWVLRREGLTLFFALLTCAATVTLYVSIPKDFMPPQDVGVVSGAIEGAEDASPAERRRNAREVSRIILSDPAVTSVAAAITSWGDDWLDINLKPFEERKATASEVIERLRPQLGTLVGVTTHLHPIQDFWMGGRQGYGQYEYTLQGEDWDELSRWVPIVRERLRRLPELKDVESYVASHGVEAELRIDRDRAAQLGVSPKLIAETLYDAFGQRQIATVYGATDQLPIVLDVDADRQDLGALRRIYVKSADGDIVPLAAVTRPRLQTAPMSIPRRGQLPFITLTFNLNPGASLGQAIERIRAAELELRLPATLHSGFEGNARAFESLAASHPVLILAAILTVYIVLGVLYESYVHPLTILSTLPSAGLGALLALLACGLDLSMVAFVGIILLVGIVAKNAIIMIDFALDAERRGGAPATAILEACLLRFRPIVMTTLTAALASLPLALSTGPGAALRQPLGIAVAGGLLVSQFLTLYTTPVIYLFLGRLHRRPRDLAASSHRSGGKDLRRARGKAIIR